MSEDGVFSVYVIGFTVVIVLCTVFIIKYINKRKVIQNAKRSKPNKTKGKDSVSIITISHKNQIAYKSD